MSFAVRKLQLFFVGLALSVVAGGAFLYLARPTEMFASPAFAIAVALPVAIVCGLALTSGCVTSARLCIETSTPNFVQLATTILGSMGYSRTETEDGYLIFRANGFPSRKVILSIIAGNALITGTPRDVRAMLSKIPARLTESAYR